MTRGMSDYRLAPTVRYATLYAFVVMCCGCGTRMMPAPVPVERDAEPKIPVVGNATITISPEYSRAKVMLHPSGFWKWSITDIERLRGDAGIKHVDIERSVIDRGCFAVLATMPNLHNVTFTDVRLSDSEWNDVGHCSELTIFSYSGPEIPESAVTALCSIRSLVEVNLGRDAVSSVSAERLSARVPTIRVRISK